MRGAGVAAMVYGEPNAVPSSMAQPRARERAGALRRRRGGVAQRRFASGAASCDLAPPLLGPGGPSRLPPTTYVLLHRLPAHAAPTATPYPPATAADERPAHAGARCACRGGAALVGREGRGRRGAAGVAAPTNAASSGSISPSTDDAKRRVRAPTRRRRLAPRRRQRALKRRDQRAAAGQAVGRWPTPLPTCGPRPPPSLDSGPQRATSTSLALAVCQSVHTSSPSYACAAAATCGIAARLARQRDERRRERPPAPAAAGCRRRAPLRRRRRRCRKSRTTRSAPAAQRRERVGTARRVGAKLAEAHDPVEPTKFVARRADRRRRAPRHLAARPPTSARIVASPRDGGVHLVHRDAARMRTPLSVEIGAPGAAAVAAAPTRSTPSAPTVGASAAAPSYFADILRASRGDRTFEYLSPR